MVDEMANMGPQLTADILYKTYNKKKYNQHAERITIFNTKHCLMCF